jgi:hypothetical protein
VTDRHTHPAGRSNCPHDMYFVGRSLPGWLISLIDLQGQFAIAKRRRKSK